MCTVRVHNKVENNYMSMLCIRATLVHWLEGFEVVKWGEHCIETAILYSLAHFSHCMCVAVCALLCAATTNSEKERE